MLRRHIVHCLYAVVVLSVLAACGPAASPVPPASPMPTETPVPTPSPDPTDTPAPSPTPNDPEGEPMPLRDGFEEGLDPWQKGSDVPEDPERPGEPIAWLIDVSDEQAAEGASSARFTIDGKQDDGTIWLMRALTVEPNETLNVQLSFDLWSASESFNTLAKVAAYAGAQPPDAEGDFDTSQPANVVAGWRTYNYVFEIPSGADGQLWVALGISAVWETEMTYYIDQVAVDADYAEQGQPSGEAITITGVQSSAERVVVRGASSLPEGSCVSVELWGDGVMLDWWPVDACAPVQSSKWELMVPLDPGRALRPGVQYMVRAYQPGGPNLVATFPFDLDGPPNPPSQPPQGDPTLLLPESAEPLHRASADLDGDGIAEEIVLTGWGGGPDQLGYDFLQLFVIGIDEGAYVLAWQSEQLPTDRGEPMMVRDVNGDGYPEVLSVQAVGASGQTVYVLAWKDGAYGWLRPHGGRFDRQPSFGEHGARAEDVDGDGLMEILASYGPAAQSTDVYAWDGQAYVYRETLGGSDVSYQRVPAAGAGLSLELPCGWTQIEPGTWAPPSNPALRLGVRWADLEPPQEPEAALLPQPAQVLDSRSVTLPWGDGRWFTVQVFEAAAEGEGQAPVDAVEHHVLVVREGNAMRRAIDIFASAPTGEQLAALDAVFQRAISSVQVP